MIQKVFRGYRTRVQIKRHRCLQSLMARVHELVTSFIVTGNFWGFIIEIDADYRRFMAKIAEESTDAATFASTVLMKRQHDENQALQVCCVLPITKISSRRRIHNAGFVWYCRTG